MTEAFLHNGPAKMEIRLEKLMAAGRSVHDVRCYAVLRHDHCANSFCGRPFFRSGGFGEVSRVYVESRSEEHTSEIHSHLNIVYPLFLAKKNITIGSLLFPCCFVLQRSPSMYISVLTLTP